MKSILILFISVATTWGDLPPSIYAPPTIPIYTPPVYHPPIQDPPIYHPPVYQPPVYQPPVYQPPVVYSPRIPNREYGPTSQESTVYKHVYIHVPPPDNDYHHEHKQIQVAAKQKHYKIIFIKTPSPPTQTVPKIEAQLQNEEKTIVYVLVKKPEAPGDIIIPTAPPTQPSKPEVYFIKYKTQKQRVEGYPDRKPVRDSYGVPN